MSSEVAPHEVLVVLGCRVGPGGQVGGALRRRLLRAAEARRDQALVLVCGGRRWEGQPEAWVMRRFLVERGVPADKVMVELRSLTTSENAREAARLLRTRGVERVGVVTCDWHMERALRLFARAGLEARALPAASPVGTPPERAYRWLRERTAGWLDALR